MKKYNLLFSAIISCFSCSNLDAQNKFSDLSFDKSGNKYVIGNFENTIDLGNNNIITSKGSHDCFIGKYDSKGICQWGTKIGGANSDNIGGIYVEPNGNFYITGSFIAEAKFGDLHIKSPAKAYQRVTLFVAKYNPSGDPIWVKISKNTASDAGYGITSDNNGNIFVIGNFEGQLNFDGKTVNSNGKNDIFVLKINKTGNCEWIKNYGDKNDNIANTIFYNKGKLAIGGNFQIEPTGYLGYLAQISPETGNSIWTKTIGAEKGDVEKITIDYSSSNYIITGSIESSNNYKDGYNLFVNKISASDGKDIWMKKFQSNQSKGRDIVCDANDNIIVTGSFIDSLRLDQIFLSSITSDEIFLLKMNSLGKVTWAKNYGHNKNDVGCKLLIQGNEMLFAGEFTTNLELSKTALSGGENTIFTTIFDPLKLSFSNSTVLVKEEKNLNPNSKFSNISGKLLIGSGKNKSFLNDQAVFIEDQNGNFIKRTLTDENGDFSFKNIDVSESVNLVLEKNEKLKETDEIYLAQQNGIIVQKLELDKNKNFQYKMLPITMSKLEPLEDEKDPAMVMKEFKSSKESEFTMIERILYEPNSFTIPSESVQSLNQVALFLRQNPKMKIEIYSHTDATGDDASNLILSEKRANEVKLFLTKKQIQSERITTKGLGETQIINRCENNVKCTDTEHSYNRRTEFKFIKGSGF